VLKLQEHRHQQTQSLNTAVFLHTDELVANVLDINVRQYQFHNGMSLRTRDQRRFPGIIALPRQNFLIIFRCLFTARYVVKFPLDVEMSGLRIDCNTIQEVRYCRFFCRKAVFRVPLLCNYEVYAANYRITPQLTKVFSRKNTAIKQLSE